MQRTLVAWFRHTPLLIPYFCMAWIVPFYMIKNRTGYLSMYDYFRKRHGYGRLKAFWNVYANHFVFGQIIIDRFGMYAGKHFKIEVEGEELYNGLDQCPGGFMLFSSHVGNYELAGYSLVPKSKSFNVLVYAGETQQVMSGREAMFDGKRINMIQVAEDMSHLFLINSALSEGNIVSIPCDRVFGSPRSAVCDFLGGKARFPIGPFALAVQHGVAALAVFVMKESVGRYKIYVRRLPAPKAAKKKEQIGELAQAFAHELETILRKYPTQWFNYYDFWES